MTTQAACCGSMASSQTSTPTQASRLSATVLAPSNLALPQTWRSGPLRTGRSRSPSPTSSSGSSTPHTHRSARRRSIIARPSALTALAMKAVLFCHASQSVIAIPAGVKLGRPSRSIARMELARCMPPPCCRTMLQTTSPSRMIHQICCSGERRSWSPPSRTQVLARSLVTSVQSFAAVSLGARRLASPHASGASPSTSSRSWKSFASMVFARGARGVSRRRRMRQCSNRASRPALPGRRPRGLRPPP
mmetsp:Transcript_98084/g.245779  ORF Transcript_98084/g.245779 Transcript_98084/m.245779 type:complete len:248 (-) Transcript_98084:62-805(-)